jgi:hypothetical protein
MMLWAYRVPGTESAGITLPCPARIFFGLQPTMSFHQAGSAKVKPPQMFSSSLRPWIALEALGRLGIDSVAGGGSVNRLVLFKRRDLLRVRPSLLFPRFSCFVFSFDFGRSYDVR